VSSLFSLQKKSFSKKENWGDSSTKKIMEVALTACIRRSFLEFFSGCFVLFVVSKDFLTHYETNLE